MLNKGFNVHSSELLPPDFYTVEDWKDAERTSKPIWLSIWSINGVNYAHPSVIEKIKVEK